MRHLPAHPTARYWRALDSLEAFVIPNRETLEKFLDALGRAEHAHKKKAGLVHDEFEDTAGVKKHAQLAGIEEQADGAPLILPTSLLEDMAATMERMQHDLFKEYESIRHNEAFEHTIGMHERLMQEFFDAFKACQTWEDHPLVNVRREAPEQWMIGLDEKNYDRLDATTIEQQTFVEDNIRQLAASDENDRLEKERAATKWKEKLKQLDSNEALGEFRSFNNEVIPGEAE